MSELVLIDGGVCMECGCIEWAPTGGACTCGHPSISHEELEMPQPLPPVSDGLGWLIEITTRQRRSLPPEYHRPAFSGLSEPQSWHCSVCWATDGSEVWGWPCAPVATGAGALALADSLGLEASR